MPVGKEFRHGRQRLHSHALLVHYRDPRDGVPGPRVQPTIRPARHIHRDAAVRFAAHARPIGVAQVQVTRHDMRVNVDRHFATFPCLSSCRSAVFRTLPAPDNGNLSLRKVKLLGILNRAKRSAQY